MFRVRISSVVDLGSLKMCNTLLLFRILSLKKKAIFVDTALYNRWVRGPMYNFAIVTFICISIEYVNGSNVYLGECKGGKTNVHLGRFILF